MSDIFSMGSFKLIGDGVIRASILRLLVANVGGVESGVMGLWL